MAVCCTSLSHHWRSFLWSVWGLTRRPTSGQCLEIQRFCLEHPVLNGMSSSNPSSQDSGSYVEEEAKSCKSQKRWVAPRKQCLSDTSRLLHIPVQRLAVHTQPVWVRAIWISVLWEDVDMGSYHQSRNSPQLTSTLKRKQLDFSCGVLLCGYNNHTKGRPHTLQQMAHTK